MRAVVLASAVEVLLTPAELAECDATAAAVQAWNDKRGAVRRTWENDRDGSKKGAWPPRVGARGEMALHKWLTRNGCAHRWTGRAVQDDLTKIAEDFEIRGRSVGVTTRAKPLDALFAWDYWLYPKKDGDGSAQRVRLYPDWWVHAAADLETDGVWLLGCAAREIILSSPVRTFEPPNTSQAFMVPVERMSAIDTILRIGGLRPEPPVIMICPRPHLTRDKRELGDFF